MRMITISLVLFMLGGCATSSVSYDKAKNVPEDRVALKTQGEYSFTVIRDDGWTGSGCYADLYIDEQLAAKFESGEKATFRTDENRVMLKVTNSGAALCSYDGGTNYYEAFLELDKHKIYRIHVNYDGAGLQILAGGIYKN
ncbi:hypothetical protein ACROAK_07000 [Shewanella oncorhynchi]|uniref:hypothetical protein n=1 Tax=Shewanella oncorhynchi TaxID=2726434 RepID=UPI003D7B9F77